MCAVHEAKKKKCSFASIQGGTLQTDIRTDLSKRVRKANEQRKRCQIDLPKTGTEDDLINCIAEI